METFLTFIFITFLVLYLGGMLGRWLLRRWITKKQEEFARRFSGQGGGAGLGPDMWGAGGASPGSGPKKEGEIKVQATVRRQKKVSGQVGDYVEYEEVDDYTTTEE